jgi:hypothetical protein
VNSIPAKTARGRPTAKILARKRDIALLVDTFLNLMA